MNHMPNNHESPNFCSKCGASLAGRTNFCGHCGRPIKSTIINSERATRRTSVVKATIPVVLLAAVLAEGYALVHRSQPQQSAPPLSDDEDAQLLFWQPGPPADLITMLQRGLRFGPDMPNIPTPAQMTTMKNLCTLLISDYRPDQRPYKFGSTADDPSAQDLVKREARQLVNDASQLFTDKTKARREAQFALAEAANEFYYQQNVDPTVRCKLVLIRINNPTSIFN